MADTYVCVGKLTKPHGVRGDMNLVSFTDPPENIFTYVMLFRGTTQESVCQEPVGIVRKSQASASSFLVRVGGVSDRNAAETMRNTSIWVRRQDMPILQEEMFYYVDLMGLHAHAPGGAVLGTVIHVDTFGAQTNLEICDASGVKYYLPFTKAAVPSVDKENGLLIANPDFLVAQKPSTTKES
ncbi:MAG: 16S rRNA processing protein RimM [Alphaproteobacteria bacterium]|nr:MAG: 16S rRNA processing protein RimM [Alphaproteobacteria bacterium]